MDIQNGSEDDESGQETSELSHQVDNLGIQPMGAEKVHEIANYEEQITNKRQELWDLNTKFRKESKDMQKHQLKEYARAEVIRTAYIESEKKSKDTLSQTQQRIQQEEEAHNDNQAIRANLVTEIHDLKTAATEQS